MLYLLLSLYSLLHFKIILRTTASSSDEEFSTAFTHGRNIRENSFDDQIPLEISRYVVITGEILNYFNSGNLIGCLLMMFNNIENSKFLGRLPGVINRSVNLYDPLPPPDGTNPYATHIAGPIEGNIFDLQGLLDRVPVCKILNFRWM